MKRRRRHERAILPEHWAEHLPVEPVVGNNLTNTLFRNHMSFIKDLAPDTGRGIRVGYSLRSLRTLYIVALLLALAPVGAAGQEPRLATGHWTRGLAAGWGGAWKHGVPGYGKTESDVSFAAFHPQLGRFVTDHLEIYGEGTLLLYGQPGRAVSAGLAGLGGRYHFRRDRSWTPYLVGIAGLLWTSLDLPEIDRVFNFQLVYGLGIRQVTRRGPGLLVELRNHHISNAGTAGENLGLNAATVIVGVHWVLR